MTDNNGIDYETFIKEINKSIINCIEIISNKKLEKFRYNDRPGIVTDIKYMNNGNIKYKVTVDGADHFVKDGINLNPQINTPVWIHLPNGSLEDAYISAKR